MRVELIKQFKNHPKGTILDVSDGIKADLERLGAIEKEKPLKQKAKKRKTRAVKAPAMHRMIGEAPKVKKIEEGTDESPPDTKERHIEEDK